MLFQQFRRFCFGACACVLMLNICLAAPATAQDAGEYVISDSSLDQRFDWVITMNAQIIKNYLNYPTSTLTPMTKLSIIYRQTPRLNQNRISQVVQFEDLWYHNCAAIGCRRYHELGLTPGEQGVIRVIPSDDANNSTCAIANAVTRLMLDVGLMRCSVAALYVPVASIDSVLADFAKFNFLPYQPSPDNAIRSSMTIFVASDPPGVKKYLYYNGQ
ncbi:MAG: hypothetical protein P4L53_25670 [Candidatus Obscuribacterales bacterium]|nr:hypothetical protein [Candidatus Obscuribacterales bacterium]